MNSKKTAVEYLIKHLKETYHLTEETLYEFQKAKEMEKQQIIDAWQHGFDWGMMEQSLAEQGHESTLIDAEQYYNETYGKKD
jgi:hypothetical protein